jgi:phospholipid-binding lipoprotein MlaA
MFHAGRLKCSNPVIHCTLLISFTLLAGGCASTSQPADQNNSTAAKTGNKDGSSNVDPYESFNRSMFRFNDHLDDYIAKPISDAYLWVTPGFLKSGVTNFFSNLKDINVVLNDHMQGKFGQGIEDTGRFLTNSTVGVLGLFDVASELGLNKHEEDFGQTLAVWGVPQGAYLVLPILGPTTARGVPGGVFDVAANPTSYVGMPVNLVSMLNTRANAEGALKFIDEASIDPYVFTREAFLQNQKHLINDGKVDANVEVQPLEYDIDSEVDEMAATRKAQSAAGEKNSSANNTDRSLDNAVIALNNASQSMEEAVTKLDKLNKKHSRRHFKVKNRGNATAPKAYQ